MIYNNICTLNSTNRCVYNSIYYSQSIYNDLISVLDDSDRLNIDKFLYPFHVIYSNSVFNKSYKDRDQFISLKAEILRKVIGDKYKLVINFLLTNGFLETDGIWAKKGKNGRTGKYQVGKCRWYRLTEKYKNNKFKTRQTNILNLKHLEITDPNHKYLLKLLDNIHIDINYLPELQKEIDKNAETPDSKNFVNDFIVAINSKNYHFNTDKKTGRIFNIIVNAPSYIRSYLLYKDQSLKEIDIRAAQPLLLNLLYKDSDPLEEKIRFKYVTENDDFYTYLINNSELKLDRKHTKKTLYYYLFGEKTDYPNLFPVEGFFRKHFPVLLKRIKEMKSVDYTKLAIFLQKSEATAIIDNVVKFCRLNNIPVFPIHDSFMLLRKDVATVEKETIRIFQKIYNLTPQLVVKELGKNIVDK